MRTIDLTTSILAPAVVAQIIAFASRTAGAAFIAGWNLVSGGFEIYLLNQIFTAIPQLAHKNVDEIKIPEINVIDTCSPEYGKVTNVCGSSDLPRTPVFPSGGGLCLPNQQQQELIPTPRGISLGLPASTFSEVSLTPLQKVDETATTTCFGLNSPCDTDSVRSLVKDVEKGSNVYRRWHRQVFKSLEGWEEYFNQRVRWAGVGLALLYMTVLGFDSITIGKLFLVVIIGLHCSEKSNGCVIFSHSLHVFPRGERVYDWNHIRSRSTVRNTREFVVPTFEEEIRQVWSRKLWIRL